MTRSIENLVKETKERVEGWFTSAEANPLGYKNCYQHALHDLNEALEEATKLGYSIFDMPELQQWTKLFANHAIGLYGKAKQNMSKALKKGDRSTAPDYHLRMVQVAKEFGSIVCAHLLSDPHPTETKLERSNAFEDLRKIHEEGDRTWIYEGRLPLREIFNNL
ncbi:MAG: hypothetical protein ACE5FT_00980 [Candidatus Nanoarchaeia archaeon]